LTSTGDLGVKAVGPTFMGPRSLYSYGDPFATSYTQQGPNSLVVFARTSRPKWRRTRWWAEFLKIGHTVDPFPSATRSGKPLLPSSSMGLFHGRSPHSGPPREIVQGGTRLLWGPEFRSLK